MRVLVAEDHPRPAASGPSVPGCEGMAHVELDGHGAGADTSRISSGTVVLDRDLSLAHGDEVSLQPAAPTAPAFY
jgi:hypothetical protein